MATRQQRDAARAVIREARALGIELRADTTNCKILYRPKHLMPLDLYRRLQEHRRTILLILSMLATPIPPDGSPSFHERCQFCGACVWLCPVGVWQCGECHALWRPQPPVKVAPAANEATGTAAEREAAHG